MGVLAFWAAEPMVCVAWLTAPLALFPLAERDGLDLAVRARLELAADRLFDAEFAAGEDDRLGDFALAEGDDRLAAVVFPEPALRRLD